ncbi:MAG TPA: CAP domain-containing protein [Polyangiaceae bacterium]|nr:CAP domain-containing protein [Polyangiaceae bacterium]
MDSGGTAVSSGDGGALDAIRQLCVDQINMYRAMLNLAPVNRATPAQEACSDMGAMHDATTMMAHSSSMSCPGFPGYQNTCPDLYVSSGVTLQSSLTQCLAQMWAEGAPPGTIAACEADRTGCFLQHGHYINMSDPSLKTVSCGFYRMSSGDYWGNQDYAP